MGMMFKNGIPYAGVPDEINAATVGGHTVEADVPADAAFTDNSDITAEGNPVILKELQGGVPFSEIAVKGENISGQEMTLTATGKNQLPITVTNGTGAGVTYTVDNDEITVSGTTTGVSTITVSAPNMTITQDMRLSYRGNLSGMTPKATVLRNGETVYPTPNDTTGSKLLAGDVLQNVYIQQQNADVAVSGSAKFQLEYGTEVTEYEKYSSEICTFTPDSADYIIPTDVIQKENVNVLSIDAEGATLSATGVRTNAAVAKLWNKPGYDDTEIKASLENKLDKDGLADELKYKKYTDDFVLAEESPDPESVRPEEVMYGKIKFIGELTNNELSNSFCFKPINDKIYMSGESGCMGYFDKNMQNYTPICKTSQNSEVSNHTITDIIPEDDTTYYFTAMNRSGVYKYNTETNTVSQLYDATGLFTQDEPSNTLFRGFKLLGRDSNMYKLCFISSSGLFMKMTDTSRSLVQECLKFEDMVEGYVEPINHILEWDNVIFIAKGPYLIYWNKNAEVWANYEEETGIAPLPLSTSILKMYHDDMNLYLITNEGRIYRQTFDTENCVWHHMENGFEEIGIVETNLPNQKQSMVNIGDTIYYISQNVLAKSIDMNYFESYGRTPNYASASTYFVAPDGYYNENTKTIYMPVGTQGILELQYDSFNNDIIQVLNSMDTATAEVELLKNRVSDLEYLIHELEDRLANAGI